MNRVNVINKKENLYIQLYTDHNDDSKYVTDNLYIVNIIVIPLSCHNVGVKCLTRHWSVIHDTLTCGIT